MAEDVGKISYDHLMILTKYIGNNMIAVLTNGDVILFDLKKLEQVKSILKEFCSYFEDVLAISENRLAILGVSDVRVYDISSDTYLMKKCMNTLYCGKPSTSIKLFTVKPGQFGVLTASVVYVFD